MKPKDVITDLFLDFYFHETRPDLSLQCIKTDSEIFEVIRNINTCAKYKSTNNFTKSILKGFINKPLFRIDGIRNDSLDIEKHVLHISYNWYASLQRLIVLSNSIDEITQVQIFGITINAIYTICCIIIFRTFLFTTATMKNSSQTWEIIERALNKESLDVWFTLDELASISPSISISDLQTFMDLFACDLTTIHKHNDTPFLYSNAGLYSIIFADDFSSFVFSNVDKRIIDFCNAQGQSCLELYKNSRGKNLEYLVHQITKEVYPQNTFININYIDFEQKKREIDVLVIQPNYVLDIECKSSYFNLYDCNNDSETQMRIRGAFGKSLQSINAFCETMRLSNALDLGNVKHGSIKITEGKQVYPLQITLYPIDFIGTHLHNIETIDIGKFSVYPININFMDFYTIMFFASLNKQPFETYLAKRFASINMAADIQLDVDEIDVFGFLIDPQYDSLFDMFMQNDHGVQQIFSISNSAYRRQFNSEITNYAMQVIFSEFIPHSIGKELEMAFIRDD